MSDDSVIMWVNGWTLRRAPCGARSAQHEDGTAFSFDEKNGLAASAVQISALPVGMTRWLTSSEEQHD